MRYTTNLRTAPKPISVYLTSMRNAIYTGAFSVYYHIRATLESSITINCPLSTVHYQLSTINCQLHDKIWATIG